MDEVNALTSEYGGGNEAALHIWLQNAPGYGQKYRGGVRPREGDRIEHFKQFISDCYDKGMFKATTPFVPSMASTSGAPSPVVAARSVSSGSAGINKLTASSPAKKDYNLFEGSAAGISELSATNSQVSPSISSTDFGNDPFGSHSPFGSSLNLSGKGSQQQPTGQIKSAPASAPFDAFNTSSSQPSDSFASGFDFMSSSGPDPFASTGASQKLGGFDAFDSYSVSSHSSANTLVSQGTGGAPSGFDFMSASDPFSSAPAAAITHSSNNDLFGLSSGIANDVPAPPAVARSTSAPALALPAAPAPSTMQPAHDPFGSVFLQPTLTPSASAPSLAATGMGMQSNSTKSLPPMGGSSTNMMGNGSMGMGAMNSGMAYGMGMGAGGPSRGPMGAPMGGGMGIGMSMGSSQSQYNPGSVRGPMGNGMMMPGMGMGGGMQQGMMPGMGGRMQQGMMPGMGMGGGMQQGMTPGMSGAMGGGMRGGVPTAAAGMGGSAMMGGVRPQQPAGPGQRMDAIGSAFGGMNLGGPSSAGSSRGCAPPVSNSSNSTASSSFDFIGSNMKQQLGSL